jgi:peptidoglycan/LPS O-acetylase OafA/YrhL
MQPDRHPEESVPATIGHLDGIQALRALAATWVVLFHYLVVRESVKIPDAWNAWVTASPVANTVLRNGYLGVDLFFLLTGFLLVQPWVRASAAGAPWPSTMDFYRRRVRRIVPAYYVQLAALFLVFVPAAYGFGFLRDNAGFVAVNAVAHALFLHYTTPLTSASLNLNGSLWTLTLEAQFYLLLPFLAPLFVRRPLLVGLVMAALAAWWRVQAYTDMAPLVAWEMAIGARWNVPEQAIRGLLAGQLPGYFAHFAAGMGLGMAWFRFRARPVGPREAWAWLAALAIACLGFAWGFAWRGGVVLGISGTLALIVGGLGILVATFVRAGPLVRALVLRPPVLFVGRTSYSTYLYHLPLLFAWDHFRVLEGSVLSLPAFLAALLTVAWLSYRFVEQPFLRR